MLFLNYESEYSDLQELQENLYIIFRDVVNMLAPNKESIIRVKLSFYGSNFYKIHKILINYEMLSHLNNNITISSLYFLFVLK